jgi:hypothetical protein
MKELAVGRGLRIEGTELGQAALGETFAETGADEEQRQTAAAFTLVIAVGMPVTGHPPHRSVRAQFGHTAPTSGV